MPYYSSLFGRKQNLHRITQKTELEAIQTGLRRAETTYNLLVIITAILKNIIK